MSCDSQHGPRPSSCFHGIHSPLLKSLKSMISARGGRSSYQIPDDLSNTSLRKPGPIKSIGNNFSEKYEHQRSSRAHVLVSMVSSKRMRSQINLSSKHYLSIRLAHASPGPMGAPGCDTFAARSLSQPRRCFFECRNGGSLRPVTSRYGQASTRKQAPGLVHSAHVMVRERPCYTWRPLKSMHSKTTAHVYR